MKEAVRLLGSGAILREVNAAANILGEDWGVSTEVYSVTSYAELAREAREVERTNRLHPERKRVLSFVERSLEGTAPIVAASDYVRAYPQLIASYLGARFVVLGTDGFGRSDTRRALRSFFEMDRYHVTVAALRALLDEGAIAARQVNDAIKKSASTSGALRLGPSK